MKVVLSSNLARRYCYFLRHRRWQEALSTLLTFLVVAAVDLKFMLQMIRDYIDNSHFILNKLKYMTAHFEYSKCRQESANPVVWFLLATCMVSFLFYGNTAQVGILKIQKCSNKNFLNNTSSSLI